MNVLVGYATAHGSSQGIAERIADGLRVCGADVTLARMADIEDVARFDAAVLGSAVHSGKWLPEAERFVQSQELSLAGRPTWLFSVCSIGDSNSFFPARVGRFLAKRRKDSKSLSRWHTSIGPEHHRYFSGALQRDHWSRLGNLFLRALGGTYGDHRDWADIEAWADSINKTLKQTGTRQAASRRRWFMGAADVLGWVSLGWRLVVALRCG